MYSEITFPGLGLTLNPSPVAFTVFGKEVYWYGIIIACGMLAAYFLMCRKAPKIGMTEDHVLDILMCAVPIGIVGARAYYCIFYWELFADSPVSVFYIWKGGLAIYGGVIAGILALLVYALCSKKPFPAVLDLASFGVLIGQVFGRWGNFFNREAHGGETDALWRMGLWENGTLKYYHPTFLYESLWNLIGLFILGKLLKKRKFDGQLICFYLFWYGLGRAWIEGLRTDSLYLFGTGIRVSQLLAVLCVWVFGLILIIKMLFKHPDPAKMYVNVLAEKAAAAEAEKAAQEAAESEAEAEKADDAETEAETECEPEPAGEEAVPGDAEGEQPEESNEPEVPEEVEGENKDGI